LPLTAPRPLADGYSFLEGPRWHNGRLLASDFYTGRVLAFDAEGGETASWRIEGQPSGLGILPDGSFAVVSMLDRCLLRIRNDSIEPYADLSNISEFPCNDMLVDGHGRAYVGNFGGLTAAGVVEPTFLVRVDPDGSCSVVADQLVFPNGMALTTDGATLLVAETFASRISVFGVAPDGSLVGRQTWADFGQTDATVQGTVASGLPLPDGMALDEEGAVWIGDAAGGAALRIARGGQVLDRVETAPLAVYAVALGGADRQTLFMCAAPPLLEGDPANERRAVLLSCRVSVPGAGLP
jgi:sugar lactone lactonase YvrE